MALLERINSMKQGGMSDSQIINSLKEEGISPLEINEALTQSQIKTAVSNPAGMEPSMMAADSNQQQYASVPDYQGNVSTPAYGQMYSQEAPQAAQAYQDQQAYPQYQDQQAYAQQAYDQAGYSAQGLDVETVRDISKQQVEEGLKKMREEIASLSKLKTELKFEMTDVQTRLAQVESVIHEIQSAVIRKIGEYGESIAGISKEVRATQQSFAKVINPLMDRRRGISEEAGESEEQEEPKLKQSAEKLKPSSKSKPAPKTERANNPTGSFEDYFR